MIDPSIGGRKNCDDWLAIVLLVVPDDWPRPIDPGQYYWTMTKGQWPRPSDGQVTHYWSQLTMTDPTQPGNYWSYWRIDYYWTTIDSIIENEVNYWPNPMKMTDNPDPADRPSPAQASWTTQPDWHCEPNDPVTQTQLAQPSWQAVVARQACWHLLVFVVLLTDPIVVWLFVCWAVGTHLLEDPASPMTIGRTSPAPGN